MSNTGTSAAVDTPSNVRCDRAMVAKMLSPKTKRQLFAICKSRQKHRVCRILSNQGHGLLAKLSIACMAVLR